MSKEELIPVLKNILDGREPTEDEELIIKDFIAKNEEKNLSTEDIFKFVKKFFELYEFFEKYLE